MNKLAHIKCPTCSKPNTWNTENKFRPFCSERCKLIDLGTWADESNRLAGEEINPEDIDRDENN